MLGIPILTSALVILAAFEFWHALLMVIVGMSITFVAAWGEFVSENSDRTWDPISRFALGTTIFIGVLMAGVTGIALALATVEPRHSNSLYTSYDLLPDGSVIIVTGYGQSVVSITDLAGAPLGQYKQIRDYLHLNRVILQPAISLDLGASRVPWQPVWEGYRNSNRFFARLATDGWLREAWYYVPGDREIMGYDTDSNLQIGSIGPDGSTAGTGHIARRFDPGTRPTMSARYGSSIALLLSPSAVYHPDVKLRRVEALLSVPVGEVLQDAAEEDQTAGTTRHLLAGVTDKALYLVPIGNKSSPESSDEKPVGPVKSISLRHDPSECGHVQISEISGGLIVECSPSWRLGRKPCRCRLMSTGIQRMASFLTKPCSRL